MKVPHQLLKLISKETVFKLTNLRKKQAKDNKQKQQDPVKTIHKMNIQAIEIKRIVVSFQNRKILSKI